MVHVYCIGSQTTIINSNHARHAVGQVHGIGTHAVSLTLPLPLMYQTSFWPTSTPLYCITHYYTTIPLCTRQVCVSKLHCSRYTWRSRRGEGGGGVETQNVVNWIELLCEITLKGLDCDKKRFSLSGLSLFPAVFTVATCSLTGNGNLCCFVLYM